ncbi:Na+/H+ antiporter NhaC [Paraferrimonas sp. SM1919]|uniref:Na+/H+ antiporter NhaC n=1 Tax=Paraferrimonas sp. SM1919 TaxID=2662263 RepID=UPI001F09EFD6|nr:Na+/H+ antiporter NhaC [Paraferrimonas sp. SM1919]
MQAKPITLTLALVPLFILITLLSASLYLFGDNSSQGANQIALIISACVAIFIGFYIKLDWDTIEHAIIQSVGLAMGAMMILFAVGALIGTWILSGTVPTMIYYGLNILSPDYFYPACCILSAVIALSIGSSWTVAGTIGIALIGIAQTLGLSVEITAGAIISGAYFGDKMSPLSDTTNLAPAVAGSELFAHIKHMLWTALPSLLIALVGFFLITSAESSAQISNEINSALTTLENNYSPSFILLSPLALVLYLAYKKVPAFISIIIGALFGGVIALIFQPHHVIQLASSVELSTPLQMIKGLWIALFSGNIANTGDMAIDALLSRGGMSSMVTTIWLVISAMIFGGAMEVIGALERILQSLLSFVHSTTSLIITTLATCIGANMITGDQYIAIVLPGRLLKMEYQNRNLAPVNLSRAIEDSATMTSPLVPWNTCGAFMAATLGVATLDYLPYAFFNLVCPAIAAIYAIKLFKVEPLEGLEQAHYSR